MLTSLEIQNFRGFEDLKFESLSRVNLIAGENNTGKTAVLEALYLLFCNEMQFRKFPWTFRNLQDLPDVFENFWLWLAYRKNNSGLSSIDAGNGNDLYSVRMSEISDLASTHFQVERVKFEFKRQTALIVPIPKTIVTKQETTFSKPPNWPVVSVFSAFTSPPMETGDAFDKVAQEKDGEETLAALLKIVEPRLSKLRYSKAGIVIADVGLDHLIPVTHLGEGFNRLLRLYCGCLYAKPQIILIDELENGIHHGALEKVWTGIAEIARKQDLQFFITTHSYECIRAAHKVFSKSDSYDLALHRLEWTKSGDIRAVTYDKETLGTSFKLGWEVR